MKMSTMGKSFLMACVLAGAVAWGESRTLPVAPSGLDLAVTYDGARAQTAGEHAFWLQGGSVQLHGRFYKNLGVVADVATLRTANMHGAGVGLTLVTTTFGPRYTYKLPWHSAEVYGQTLLGLANGADSVFPASSGAESSAFGLALNLGGGVNLPLGKSRFAWRAVESSWVRTQLPNSGSGSQNHWRLGSGMVIHF